MRETAATPIDLNPTARDTDRPVLVNSVSGVLFFTMPVVCLVSLLPANAKLIMGLPQLFALSCTDHTVFRGDMPGVGPILLAAPWAGALVVVGEHVFARRGREFALHR